MVFSEMVREARRLANLSQGALARQMRTSRRPDGVWPTYVGQIEKGEKVPSDELCVKLAEVLDLDTVEVLLAAYEARADSEQAKALFQKMKRALTDPLIGQLLAAEEPLDPNLLEALVEPEVRHMLVDADWRRVLARAYGMRRKRDIPGLVDRIEVMNDKQWNGLMTILEGMGL